MKQLFIDLLTKQKPSSVSTDEIIYKIKGETPDDNIWISVYWRYFTKDYKVNPNLNLPFDIDDEFGYSIPSDQHPKKQYRLRINSFRYDIDLNPVEMNEVDRVIYQIFQAYQIELINKVKDSLNKDDESTTPEQKFDAAQEKVAEDNGNE